MKHVDDHILTIEVHGDRVHHEMECPWAATPELRRGGAEGKVGCGLLTACGCGEDYSRTRDKLEAYFEMDLELYDWLEGYGGPAGQLHGDSHGDCPRNAGLTHYEWEGEVMVIGTECGYIEQLDALGGDLYHDALVVDGSYVVPGKYAVQMTWFHEDFEFEVLEKVA